MAGRSRIPIFHDDLSFHDRHEDAFKDMQRRIDDDFGGRGFGRGFDRWNWQDDMDRLSGDFQQLKPRSHGPRLADVAARDDFGSRESLDDNASKNMYVEHPQTKSRTFHMSFDVKDYNPDDITVKAEKDTLLIMARHEQDVGGHVNVREFSRKIKIPQDVDVEKLTSTLSNDGILTVQAPVPPKYTSVAYVNPAKPITANGTAAGSVHYKSPPPQEARASPQYQYPPPPSTQSVLNQAPQLTRMTTGPAHTPSPPPLSPPPPPQQTTLPQPPAAQPTRQIPPPEPQAPPPPPPATQAAASAPPPLFQMPEQVPLDTPVYRDSPDGKGREFELALEVSRPFTPEDVVVKLEGMSLRVEATHEEKAHGKSSTSSMSRNFDLTEDLDPSSVEAMLRSDGCLLIKGKAKPAT